MHLTVRKDLNSWGPSACSVPRLGPGTTRSQGAKVELLRRYIYYKCSSSQPILDMAKPDLLTGTGTCVTAVTCHAIGHPEHGSVSCSHPPAGEFTSKSSCTFTCAEGFRLQGPAQVECTSRGQWTQQAPVCEGKP